MFTIYIFILSPNHASNSMKYSKHLFLIYWQKRYTGRASYRVKIFDCKTCFWLICNKLVYRPTLLLQSHTLRLSSQTKLFYVTSMLCFTLLYVVALCVKMRYVILCIKRLLIDCYEWSHCGGNNIHRHSDFADKSVGLSLLFCNGTWSSVKLFEANTWFIWYILGYIGVRIYRAMHLRRAVKIKII